MSTAPKLMAAALACALANAIVPRMAFASEALAQRYGCADCHHAQHAGTGPSWESIRAKVRGGSRTADQIADTIRTGCMANGLPMSPDGQRVPEADARRLADWIVGAH